MNLRLFATLAASMLLVVACSSAQAQPKLPSLGDDSSSGETAKGTLQAVPPLDQIVELVKKAPGYSNVEIIDLTKDKKAVRAKVNDVTVGVIPMHCKDDKCMALTFALFLGKQKNVDIKWANAWNYNRLYGRAYLNNDGEFIFDMSIHFFGGITPAYITESADLFGVYVKDLFSFKP
jgi:hypothetical protein